MVLPEPVAPTRAIVSPGARSRLTSRSTSSSGRPGRRSRRARSAGGLRVLDGWPPETIAGSVSKISRIRAAEVIASWAIARMTPSDATGHTSDSIRVMKATSSPGVRSPRPTPIEPSSSTTTTAKLGITSRKVQNFADSRTLSMLVACSCWARLVLLGDVLAAAEGLDHPDADGALLGQGREVALLVLHPPRHHDVGLLEAHREPDDRRGGGGDDESERPVHVQQHDRDDDDLDDVDDQEEQPEAAEPPDRGEVGGRPREQLTRLPPAVELIGSCWRCS